MWALTKPLVHRAVCQQQKNIRHQTSFNRWPVPVDRQNPAIRDADHLVNPIKSFSSIPIRQLDCKKVIQLPC